MTAELHTLTTSCWCQPLTALDGHVNEDGSQPVFAATDQDPVDEHGFLVETASPDEMTAAELDTWLKKANDDLIATIREHVDVEAGLRDVLRRARLMSEEPTS